METLDAIIIERRAMGEVQLDAEFIYPQIQIISEEHSESRLKSLAEVEIEHIIHVLEKVGGNKSKASRILGISRKTLREKLRQSEFILA